MSTVVLLLEKERSKKRREENIVRFISVDENVDVNHLLHALKGKNVATGREVISVAQKRLEMEDRWFIFFRNHQEPIFWGNELFIRLSDLFHVSKGNTQWHIEEMQGTGADGYFFLSQDRARRIGIPMNHLPPAVRNTKDVIHFTLKPSDIDRNENRGRPTLFFSSESKREDLDPWAKRYILWGETECRISERKGGSICSVSRTCINRSLHPKYHFWYNLGYRRRPVFISTYSAWNKTRFTLNLIDDIAVGHSLLTFFYRDGKELEEEELMALMAYLNSSYCQLFVDLRGRKTGGGAVALEVTTAEQIPVPNLQLIDAKIKRDLALMFQELEGASRTAGGAVGRSQMESLNRVIHRIDMVIDNLLRGSRSYFPLHVIEQVLDDLINKRRADSGKAKAAIVVRKQNRNGD